MHKKLVIFFLILLIAPMVSAQEGVMMKKVVMIIAQEGFRDEELLEPKRILEEAGIEVKVASESVALATGMLGVKVKPDVLIDNINVSDFYAIIFVGGQGASVYWDNPLAHKIAQEAYAKNKIVGAICIAPVTLARAGLLKGRRATVFPSEAGQLREVGANYTASSVEKDGNIITASGPMAAKEFGDELVRALKY